MTEWFWYPEFRHRCGQKLRHSKYQIHE